MTCTYVGCTQNPLTQCFYCPEVPPSRAIPPHYESTNVFGWDAGARSYDEIDGDLFLTYDVPAPIGAAVCGIAPVSNYAVANPSYVQHGILVYTVHGVHFWSTWESAIVGTAVLWSPAPDAVLNVRIVRAGTTVVYQVTDGTTTWVDSFQTPSTGKQLTLGCLYSAGDRIV